MNPHDRQSRLVRLNPELHKVAKIISINRGLMLGAFLQNCRGVWLSGDRPFYESVTGDKQVSFPTHERIDKEFRIAAANFSGGLAVNEAYASATMHGVRAFAHEMDYTGLSPEIETSVESLAGNALYRL